jgi:8-oxo-dGTP diphosphatase
MFLRLKRDLPRALINRISHNYSIGRNNYTIRRMHSGSKDSSSSSKPIDEYGRPYPPKTGNYYLPNIATDAVCTRVIDGQVEILMITRGGSAEKGKLALPGGFVNYNERPENACVRELMEETGVKGSNPTLVGVFGDPLRDPRKHVISITYAVECDPNSQPKADDDAADAKFYKLEDILNRKDIAFDHLEIIKKFKEKFLN